MGILDRIRNRNRETESKLRFGEREASTKAKAKKDLRRAKAAARAKAARAKARAASGAREAARGARENLKEADVDPEQRTAGNVDAPRTTREVFELAGQSAGLRSPVDATIDPSPDGPINEQFATRDMGLSFERSRRERDGPADDSAPMDPGFVTGESEPFADSNDSGDGEEVEENPLEFSDDWMGEGGTWL